MLKLRLSSDLIVPAYIVGVTGAFLQISGGTWDVASHTMRIVETFFTIPHLILYAGVVLSLLASLAGFVLKRNISGNNAPQFTLLTGLRVTLVGGVLQLIAAPFDFWWHNTYGFDPHLFTPSHSLLITGIILSGVGMAIGTTRLLQAKRTGISLGTLAPGMKWLQLLAIASLTTLWLDLNGLVYLITDVNGLDYTFHFGQAWVNQAEPIAFPITSILLAGTGILVILTTKNTLGWTGAVSAVTLLSALVVTTANLGFRAWYLTNSSNPDWMSEGSTIASFIPLYALFLAPIVLFDLVVKNSTNRTRMVIAAALVAPFASYLDGFYSVVVWTQAAWLLPWMLAPMLATATVAALYQARFLHLLTSGSLNPVQGPSI